VGQPHRIGIVGLGVISSQYLEMFRSRGDVRVTAVADLDAAHATEVAATIPGACALTVAELVSASDVDVVLNLTIPAAHAEIALAAIAAGKDVYGEKPLAETFDQAQRVVAAADMADVRLGCAPDTVLGTGTQTARDVVDSGRIGRPLAATAMMASAGPELWHPRPDFYYQAGGGPLLDMGPYYVSALVQLFGPVQSVIGAASRLRGERTIATGVRAGEIVRVEVDTHVTGVLQHDNGVLSTLTTSFDSVATRSSSIEVHCEAGSLVVPDPNGFAGNVTLHALGGHEWSVVEPSAGYTNAARGIGLIDLLATPRSQAPRASGRFALHALEVMTSLLESARSGQRIGLSTTVERPARVPLGS